MRSTLMSFLVGITIAIVIAVAAAVAMRRPAEPPASVLVARSGGDERDPAERALADARRAHARAQAPAAPTTDVRAQALGAPATDVAPPASANAAPEATAAHTPAAVHAPEVASLLHHEDAAVAARPTAVAPSETVAPPDANALRSDAETSGTHADEFDGWWLVTNSVEETSYPAYEGLRLGYRVHLHRDGDRVSGRGYKWTENGRRVPPSARTPIFVSGIVRDGRLQVRFVEHGTERVTEGRFQWQLSRDATRLSGRFASTAADSSGRSEARRVM